MKKLTLLVAGLAFATASFACEGKDKAACNQKGKADCKKEAKAGGSKACCKKGDAKKA